MYVQGIFTSHCFGPTKIARYSVVMLDTDGSESNIYFARVLSLPHLNWRLMLKKWP